MDNPEERSGFIYTITNSLTGKVYVGSSVDPKRRFYLHRRDLDRGCHHSPILQNAWNKYGEASFVFDVVEQVDDTNFMVAREQFWIWRNQHMIMNCSPTAGSPVGVRRTEEQKRAASEARKVFCATPKGRAYIEALHSKNRGRKQSSEERSMRSARLKGVARGREWTDEQRAAHSRALTGRKMPEFSAEWKANISAGIRRAKEAKRGG